MLRFLEKPSLEVSVQHPNWICGRQLTWLELEIQGSCWVYVSSPSHVDWKPVKIKSSKLKSISIAVPIESKLLIKTWSFTGSSKRYFEVPKADWILTPPIMPTIAPVTLKPAKEAIKVWNLLINKANCTISPLSKRVIKKINLKRRYISVRVSKDKFGLGEDRPV
jgi:hypothetical protein